jgi:hypothetical protein
MTPGYWDAIPPWIGITTAPIHNFKAGQAERLHWGANAEHRRMECVEIRKDRGDSVEKAAMKCHSTEFIINRVEMADIDKPLYIRSIATIFALYAYYGRAVNLTYKNYNYYRGKNQRQKKSTNIQLWNDFCLRVEQIGVLEAGREFQKYKKEKKETGLMFRKKASRE